MALRLSGLRHASSPRVLSGSARRACPVRAKQNLRRLQTCESAPALSRRRARRSSLRSFPRRGVRNDWARTPRPRRPHGLDAGSPHAVFATAHGRWSSPTPKIVELNRASEADLRLRSARGWILRLAACPRGCHWRRRAPVRASCRPDMHLGRPPVLPASVPVRFLRIGDPPLRPGSGIVAATHIPLPRFEDDRDAPLTGAGWRR